MVWSRTSKSVTAQMHQSKSLVAIFISVSSLVLLFFIYTVGYHVRRDEGRVQMTSAGWQSLDQIVTPTPDKVVDEQQTIAVDPYLRRNFSDDALEIKYIQYLTRGHTVNGTIILVQSNLASLDLSLNLDCALRVQGAPPPIFWVTTAKTQTVFRSLGLTTYFNPSVFGIDRDVSYHSKDYNRMMRERPRVWSLFLDAGINLFWMDADIGIIGDPFKALHRNADLEIQADLSVLNIGNGDNDFNTRQACAGLFHLMATEGGRRLTTLMAENLVTFPESEDQEILNETILREQSLVNIIGPVRGHDNVESDDESSRQSATLTNSNDKITVRYVHPIDWPNGHLLQDREIYVRDGTWWYRSNGSSHQFPRPPQIVHMNAYKWHQKERALKQHGAWFLGPDYRCDLSM